MSGRPNIVFVMADQWAAASVGAFGCQVPGSTPHLDELARDGVRHARHYTVAPICGPSRSAIFTGRSPLGSGVVGNDVSPRPDTPFFTHALRSAGYRTSGVGKFHFGSLRNYPPTDLRHLGFDEVAVTEDTKHGPWLDWIRAEHPDFYPCALGLSWPMPYLDSYPPDGRSVRAEWQRARSSHVEPLSAPPYRRIFHPSPLPAELHQTTWITDRAIASIDARRAERTDDPFFLFVSYVDPHDPYQPPEPYANRHDWRSMPAPVPQEWTREDCPWEYPAFIDNMFEIRSFDAESWARLRALYFGSCSFVDEQIGRLRTHLRRTGLEKDTVILFTTDHGDLIGDHGLLMKGPWHYDKSIRCPMIVTGPGVARGREFRGLTSGLDLFPTVLALAGVEGRVVHEGVPLPVTEDRLTVEAGHDTVGVETNNSYLSERDLARTVLSSDGWRLTLFPGQDYGELFHLEQDPGEQRNLFRDPGSLKQRLRMTEAMVEVSARQAVPASRRRQPRSAESQAASTCGATP